MISLSFIFDTPLSSFKLFLHILSAHTLLSLSLRATNAMPASCFHHLPLCILYCMSLCLHHLAALAVTCAHLFLSFLYIRASYSRIIVRSSIYYYFKILFVNSLLRRFGRALSHLVAVVGFSLIAPLTEPTHFFL